MCNAGVLALIDRNFQGFGKELFTDAGKYVIHFGDAPGEAARQVRRISQLADLPKDPSLDGIAKNVHVAFPSFVY